MMLLCLHKFVYVLLLSSLLSLYSYILCGPQFHELAAEAFYLMAMVYDKLGQLEEREEAAASFQKHILALENNQNEDDPLVSVL